MLTLAREKPGGRPMNDSKSAACASGMIQLTKIDGGEFSTVNSTTGWA